MTEEEFEQEVRFYQQATLEIMTHADSQGYWDDRFSELSTRFNALTQNDLSHARRLCAWLLADERKEVRLGALKLIGSSRIKDNVLSVALIHIAFQQKDLREEALFALWRVGTRCVLPQLLVLADRGYSSALYKVRWMLQTPEEIEQGIAIAHKYIDANDYELREAALFLLQRYSTMQKEGERVLGAVQKYTDELFISALREALPEMVLEPLKALRSRFPETSAEYGDLSSTIQKLEQKKSTADVSEVDRH